MATINTTERSEKKADFKTVLANYLYMANQSTNDEGLSFDHPTMDELISYLVEHRSLDKSITSDDAEKELNDIIADKIALKMLDWAMLDTKGYSNKADACLEEAKRIAKLRDFSNTVNIFKTIKLLFR